MTQPARESKKILIADDDLAILDALEIMLTDALYEVVTTANGQEVTSLAKEQPDLLLLDISMSGVDGRDICRTIKGDTATKHIPIIIISAKKDTEDIARDCGADDFLNKPFDMLTLLQKMDKQLIETNI